MLKFSSMLGCITIRWEHPVSELAQDKKFEATAVRSIEKSFYPLFGPAITRVFQGKEKSLQG
jgi:hypothetical protein